MGKQIYHIKETNTQYIGHLIDNFKTMGIECEADKGGIHLFLSDSEFASIQNQFDIKIGVLPEVCEDIKLFISKVCISKIAS